MAIKNINTIFEIFHKDLFSIQFIKFVFAGVLTTILALFSRILLQYFFHYSYSIAISSCLAAAVNFLLSKFYVYKVHDQHITVQTIKFILISLIAVVLITSIASLIMFIYKLFHTEFISESLMESLAQIIALGVNMLYGFFIKKYFVFKK